MSTIDDIRAQRIEKIKLLADRGISAYPIETSRSQSVADFLKHAFRQGEDGAFVPNEDMSETLAGRIMSLRPHGGSTFFHIHDGSERIQAYLKEDDVGADTYALFGSTTDIGDYVEVEGTPFVTKRGERSILLSRARMLAKSLRPLPSEHFGISDDETRYRQRYLDMLMNDDVRLLAQKRSLFWNAFRSYLLARDFVEVETPILENTTGGAEANPFKTHLDTLDIDLYLRISPELWHKRLLIGNVPRVFEIGRIFRNEGISAEHANDYTGIEFYQAFSDMTEGMIMLKDLYQKVALATIGTTTFTHKGHTVDLAGDWEMYDYCALIKANYSIDPLTCSLSDVEVVLREQGIAYDRNGLSLNRAIDLLWKKIRKGLAGPGFLINVPLYMEPLAKASETNSAVVERFQVILAGSEVGKGFSELNDPLDQRRRFEYQASLREAGDAEAQMMDESYVEAMEYGMPPAFGFGVSERFFAFLLGKDLRECQLFPLMRPEK